MCPSWACNVNELIVILQSITKVDEVEDSNKSILNKLSQIDPCPKMTSSNKLSKPFQLKWKSYPNCNNVKSIKDYKGFQAHKGRHGEVVCALCASEVGTNPLLMLLHNFHFPCTQHGSQLEFFYNLRTLLDLELHVLLLLYL
jgi:hypothetical protein